MYVDIHESILNLKDTLNKLRDDIQRLEEQCHNHFTLPKRSSFNDLEGMKAVERAVNPAVPKSLAPKL